MSPKEKARKLVQKFIDEAYYEDSTGLYTPTAIKSSLIAVDEILLLLPLVNRDFWQEVKQELEKL